MKQSLSKIALLVRDYDEAIQFYVKKLSFDLVEDTPMDEGKRWVVVKPKGAKNDCCLLLAKAKNEEQLQFVGNQTGGRVFLFLYTDNLERDYQNLIQHHITIIRPISAEVYGKVLVFADLYGNLWDLIQPSK
ncbi:MAG: VOC family protein [Flavobacteriaceae bacterium]